MLTDSAWDGDKATRRSVTDIAVFVFGTLVHWRSTQQGSVTLSTAEAEMTAISDGACKAMRIFNLLHELGLIIED